MISANHGCLVGFSKPTVFTGASAMFLLVYLALWKYHDGTTIPLNIIPGEESNAATTHRPEDLMEQVIFCDPDVQVDKNSHYHTRMNWVITLLHFRWGKAAYCRRMNPCQLFTLSHQHMHDPSKWQSWLGLAKHWAVFQLYTGYW